MDRLRVCERSLFRCGPMTQMFQSLLFNVTCIVYGYGPFLCNHNFVITNCPLAL